MKAQETLKQLVDAARPTIMGSPERTQVLVGIATCSLAGGADRMYEALVAAMDEAGIRDSLDLGQVGCVGRCSLEPLVEIRQPGEAPRMYVKVDPEMARAIVQRDLVGNEPIREWMIDEGERDESATLSEEGGINRFTSQWPHLTFFNRQLRIALRNVGRIDPESLDDYLVADGYAALAKALDEMTPDEVIETLKASGLRGRGGAGFPTGVKWEFTRQAAGDEKYIVCNADEGDPGAFMDRSTLEGDPHTIIEAMLIAAYAIGSSKKGFIYVRAEYPLAIKRLNLALEAARERGLLGNSVLGTDFAFDIELRLGAGAFVCGEETALMASIEGKRGMPRPRPPFPAQRGLWGKPTCINNVETLASIPPIINNGADWYASFGTATSKGTKVFALAGNVENTGLIEVPMGVTLREIIFDIGGGIPDGREFKAAQTGGPSGGCLPAEYLDLPIDYESLREAGAIMGSGGLIVMDDSNCMVDIAKFFLTFTQDESCGKCTPCREGTKRMLDVMTRISEGKGEERDYERLERLGRACSRGALCGLGQTAPNPVLSTLRHFREEYDAHIFEDRCPAHKCRDLMHYHIDAEKCVGCGLCRRNCPTHCISGDPRKPHVIDQEACIRCGQCFEVCRFGAVIRE
jgi:NADH:ubiquinone oxidoreductase subunit F (NADH-binding)/(2Fe-2S) ferredoxin/Pyruvate/2-oxoacid:ferredoxin oxidoreductase delta subunit